MIALSQYKLNELARREGFSISDSPGVESLHLQAKACPLCHTPSLAIMPDPVHGGDWLYCRRCQYGGDVIEFIARLRNRPSLGLTTTTSIKAH